MELLSIGSSTCFDHIFELEKIPELGETVEFNFPDLTDIDKTFFGGIAFNSGVMASSLGIEAECVYFVGGDFYRRGYYSYLRDRGIPCQGIIEVGGKHCGHCFLFHDRQGRDFKIINTGASRYADEFDPDRSLISQAEMVMVSPVLNNLALKTLELPGNWAKKQRSMVLSATARSLF
ncbi:MAG: carbohydrate kinase family protein [Bacillota bacterium]